MARNINALKKHTPIGERYPDITHLAGEDGIPLCNARGVSAKKIVKENATCRSCNKRHKR